MTTVDLWPDGGENESVRPQLWTLLMHKNNGNRGNEEFVGQSTWQSCVFNTFASYGRDLKLCTERVTRTKVLKSLKLHRISSRFTPSSGENWSVTRWFFSSCFFSAKTHTHTQQHTQRNTIWIPGDPKRATTPRLKITVTASHPSTIVALAVWSCDPYQEPSPCFRM